MESNKIEKVEMKIYSTRKMEASVDRGSGKLNRNTRLAIVVQSTGNRHNDI